MAEIKRLLDTLRERNIDLGPDDVTWAFESPETRDGAQDWVREYLTPATLLSKEELVLYAI